MNKCQDCQKEISNNSVRCKKCAKLGKNNPNYKHVMSDSARDSIRQSKLGDKNPMWLGDNVSLNALHDYVKFHFAKPSNCERCGKETTFLDLANNGIYNRDIKNWDYLCRKCHMETDGRLRTFYTNMKKNHENNKNGKMVKCTQCGKEKYYRLSLLLKNKLFFCNQKCMGKYYKILKKKQYDKMSKV